MKRWKQRVAGLCAMVGCLPTEAEQLRLGGRLDLSSATREIGHCTIVRGAFPGRPDGLDGVHSSLRLFEDGKELGPAHSQHQTIRDHGNGAFSHWFGGRDYSGTSHIYFSTSDHTDPIRNGRAYTYAFVQDTERIRESLQLGLVHGGLLEPRREGWTLGLRMSSAFPPFTEEQPSLRVAVEGPDARPLLDSLERKVIPGRWLPLLAVGKLPRGTCRVQVTVPLAGGRSMTRQFQTARAAYLELDVCGETWRFVREGPWQDRRDRRGLRAVAYPWQISKTGEYALLLREVALPDDWNPPFTLTFFASDDYLVDDFRPTKGYANSCDSYPGHRFKEVLVNDEIVWERDIADPSQPGATTDFALDLTPHVTAGRPFRLGLRVRDRVGLDTPLDTDSYHRGVYEGERPGGTSVLATTAYWGDVTVWQGRLTTATVHPRPTNDLVAKRHAARWPYGPAGSEAQLPAELTLEASAQIPDIGAPVICGLPLPQGRVRDLKELSLLGPSGPVAWQPEPLTTWSDGSLRWVRANLVVPGGTNPGTRYELRRERTAPVPDHSVRVSREGNVVSLDNGVLTLTMGQSRDRLVDTLTRNGADAPQCDRLTGLVEWRDPSGATRLLTARWEHLQILRAGPVRATAELRGHLTDGETVLGPFVFRADLFAGSPFLRATYRIFNGGDATAHLTLVRLAAGRHQTPRNTVADGVPPRSTAAYSHPTEGHRLVDSDALDLVQPTADTFAIIDSPNPQTRGRETQTGPGRLDGWIAACDAAGWIAASVRHFYQQFPKRLALTPEELRLDLFAATGDIPAYECRPGEAKRHEIWLAVGVGALETESLAASVAAFQRPPRLFHPEWFCATQGLGYASPHTGEFQGVADHMAKVYGNVAPAKIGELFGFRDFGDGYYKQETPSYRNNYYDVMRGLFAEYMMSGDGRWFDRGEEATLHFMDIDQIHTCSGRPGQAGANSSVYTPHHNDAPGIWSAMLRPAGGLLTYWRLSGDEDAREAALLLADYIVRTNAGIGSASSRDHAGPLHSLTWAYDETHDPKYLDQALKLAEDVRRMLIPRRGTYAQSHGAHNYRGNVPWMDAQLAEPLYLLYRQTGRVWLAEMMVGLAESIIGENMEHGVPGHFQGYTHCPVLHRGGWQNGYNVLIAPVIAYAYELTGDREFYDVARGAYDLTVADGTINDVRNCYWNTPALIYLLRRGPE